VIKTAHFNLGKYRIEWCEIEACCDVPGDDDLAIHTPAVTDYHSFCILCHEIEHADGLPDSLIHKKDGTPNHGGRHKFLWRVVQEMIKEARK
jgi:hypothetical protein